VAESPTGAREGTRPRSGSPEVVLRSSSLKALPVCTNLEKVPEATNHPVEPVVRCIRTARVPDNHRPEPTDIAPSVKRG
jgi:hypothetical protein